MPDSDKPTNRKNPILVANVGGQRMEFPLADLLLRNGKKIPPQFVHMMRRKIDLNGSDAGKPNLMILAECGMPLDLNCFFFAIDGEGIGEPNYYFQFIGVETQDPNRRDAISAEPFFIDVKWSVGEIFRIYVGYIWQRLVILKSQSRYKSFCAETHNANILSLPPHHRQQVVNMLVGPLLDPVARPAEMKRLTRGYELMRELWADVGRRSIKYTQQEAREKSEEIVTEAKPYIEIMVWGKRADLSIEALARKMKKGKETIYSINAACVFYGQPGLIDRLKEIYKQEKKRKGRK
jgi:hypothetical protein